MPVPNFSKPIMQSITSESTHGHEVEAERKHLGGSQARWRSAKWKIAFHEAHVAPLAKLRADLACSKVELAKAQAVNKLDRPGPRDISVTDFRACVEEEASKVAMGEVDAAACEKKFKLRQGALEQGFAAKATSYEKPD